MISALAIRIQAAAEGDQDAWRWLVAEFRQVYRPSAARLAGALPRWPGNEAFLRRGMHDRVGYAASVAALAEFISGSDGIHEE